MSAIEEHPFVAEMREEFQQVLSLHEAFHADFEPAQPLFRSRFHESGNPESQDPIDPIYISNLVLPPDPDIESLQGLLQEGLAVPLPE
jgi:hypothetical protein